MNKTGLEKRKLRIMPFQKKWFEFLITYAVINVFFFLSIHGVMNNIDKNSASMFVSEPLLVDGADFSIFANLFAGPVFFMLLLANTGFVLVEEFIVILVFKSVYMMSTVEKEERQELYQNANKALLYVLPAYLVVAILTGGLHRAIYYLLLYLPVPVLTFLLVCLKIKKQIGDQALEQS